VELRRSEAWPVTGGIVDTGALTKLWHQRWPGCSKMPYELRGVHDRWVRFHTLPASKRYPETEYEYEYEYEYILGRHNTFWQSWSVTPRYSW
jgi:hypothetical protein